MVPGSVTKDVLVGFNTTPLHQYLCDGVKTHWFLCSPEPVSNPPPTLSIASIFYVLMRCLVARGSHSWSSEKPRYPERVGNFSPEFY